MSDTVHQWLRRLDSEPLPVLPATHRSVHKLLKKSSTGYQQLAEVIKKDPGFTLEVLRTIAVSRRSGRFPVRDITQAMPLLGIQWLEGAVARLPVIQRLDNGLGQSYSRALHASGYAFHFARLCRDPSPEDIADTALLFEVGEMLLWAKGDERTRAVLTHPSRTGAESKLGFTLEELSLALREHWHLGELEEPPLRSEENPKPRYRTIQLAHAISRASQQGWYRPKTLELEAALAEHLRIEEEKVVALLHGLCAESAREAHHLGLPVTASGLLLPPDKRPKAKEASRTNEPPSPEKKRGHAPPKPAAKEGRQKKQADIAEEKSATPAKPKPAPEKKGRTAAVETPRTQTKPPPAPRKTESGSSIERAVAAKRNAPPVAAPVKRAPPSPSNPLKETLSRTLREIQETAGLERVAFIKLTDGGKQLQTRLMLNRNTKPETCELKIAADKTNLFGVLLRKPQAFWMNSGNLVKYGRLLPDQIADQLGTRNFFVMPLFFKNKPVGLIYADGGREQSGLNNNSYQQFKTLCQRAVNELGQRPSHR